MDKRRTSSFVREGENQGDLVLCVRESENKGWGAVESVHTGWRWGPFWSLMAVWVGVALLLVGGLAFQNVQAQERANTPPPDYACVACHGDSAKQVALPSGELVVAGVDLTLLAESVHGGPSGGLAPIYCTDCHIVTEFQYPHVKAQGDSPIQSLRDLNNRTSQRCQDCHITVQPHNPGHLLADKVEGLPTCVDCHGGHEVASSALMAENSVATCQSCHNSYENAMVDRTHRELVANLGEDQTCRTCHTDKPLYPADAQCRTCHDLLTSQITLGSGETLDLHVDQQALADSVHGTRQIEDNQYHELLCTECHSDEERYAFPHQVIQEKDRRQITLVVGDTCETCHQDIYTEQQDSIHAHALEEGELAAATCADCHGSHAIQPPNKPRGKISLTCGNCHSQIAEQYAQSVHGAALLGQNNPDVPVCTNCHGVHDISDPLTTLFRLGSPKLCGECHADEEMMAKYEISTNVFDSYVADFHGTTVTLFEKQSPDHETNKAVCYDCHGVHNIKPVTSDSSQVIKENLLVTCQQCHPDATANFSDSWTSHFEPSLEHNTLIYLVNLFYQILIPGVLAFFVVLIVSDLFRRFILRPSPEKEGVS